MAVVFIYNFLGALAVFNFMQAGGRVGRVGAYQFVKHSPLAPSSSEVTCQLSPSLAGNNYFGAKGEGSDNLPIYTRVRAISINGPSPW